VPEEDDLEAVGRPVRQLSDLMLLLVVDRHRGSFPLGEPYFSTTSTIAPSRSYVSAGSRPIDRPPAGFSKYR
jgi:hypothetical protein